MPRSRAERRAPCRCLVHTTALAERCPGLSVRATRHATVQAQSPRPRKARRGEPWLRTPPFPRPRGPPPVPPDRRRGALPGADLPLGRGGRRRSPPHAQTPGASGQSQRGAAPHPGAEKPILACRSPRDEPTEAIARPLSGVQTLAARSESWRSQVPAHAKVSEARQLAIEGQDAKAGAHNTKTL